VHKITYNGVRFTEQLSKTHCLRDRFLIASLNDRTHFSTRFSLSYLLFRIWTLSFEMSFFVRAPFGGDPWTVNVGHYDNTNDYRMFQGPSYRQIIGTSIFISTTTTTTY
jgi:hypothetical protein